MVLSFRLCRMWMNWSSCKPLLHANVHILKQIPKLWCSFILRFHIFLSSSLWLWWHTQWSSHWYKHKISKEISHNMIWSLIHDSHLYSATTLISMEKDSFFQSVSCVHIITCAISPVCGGVVFLKMQVSWSDFTCTKRRFKVQPGDHFKPAAQINVLPRTGWNPLI